VGHEVYNFPEANLGPALSTLGQLEDTPTIGIFKPISAFVGDSPRGPLKQLGNPHFKPATKPKPNTPHLTMQDTAHAAETPTAHRGGPLEDPLEQASPHSRMNASLGRAPPCSRGCAYLEQDPPRSRVRSALEQGSPRSRALCTCAPAPVRGHLMP
jgi:hypothetical protein